MSNGNVFERLFKLLAKICMMVVDGVRDAEDVAGVLQAILDGKWLVVATPTVREMLVDWSKFYKDVYGLDLDFSGIAIPVRKHGFDRLLVVAQGMTPQRLFDKCKEMFPTRKYADRNLDEVVKSDRTAQNGHYAVWVRDREEADEENKNLSANKLAERGESGETLEERLLHEQKFFKETGEHLDEENVTLCAGSRDSDGDVPGVYFRSDQVRVSWYHTDRSYDSLRSRSVVS